MPHALQKKMKFYVNDFFRKQIGSFLQIRSILLKKVKFTKEILNRKLRFSCSDIFPFSVRKRQNNDEIMPLTSGFLMFSGGIKRDQWHEMD